MSARPRLGVATAIAAALGFTVYAVLDFSGSGSTTGARLLLAVAVACVLVGAAIGFGERSRNG